MNKRNKNIIIVSIGITIFSYLLDADAKEPSTIMRFVDFFAMSVIIFIICFVLTNIFRFAKNKINLLRG